MQRHCERVFAGFRSSARPAEVPQIHHRALFYSHDTVGLGHIRRTLLLCEGLGARMPGLSTLIVTGSAFAHSFRIPPGCDYVKLPCVKKLGNESYDTRSLGLPFEQTMRLRDQLILHATRNFKPDLFFVDNVPLGMKGELLRTLEFIRRRMPKTRVILNLRDILDDRREIVPLWQRRGVFQILERYYDKVLIYGMPDIYDSIHEYQMPDSVRSKARYCGYIPRPADRTASLSLRRKLCRDEEKLVFLMTGGGSDGSPLVENYLRALPMLADEKLVSLVVTGPEMQTDQGRRLRALPSGQARLQFMEFCDEPLSYMSASDLVISMAGYNTISEILSLGKKAIAVPRVHPRTEQLIRCRRLHELGLVKMIHPLDLNPAHLAREMRNTLHSETTAPSFRVDFGALDLVAEETGRLLAGS